MYIILVGSGFELRTSVAIYLEPHLQSIFALVILEMDSLEL
jgi:hypothetical protein